MSDSPAVIPFSDNAVPLAVGNNTTLVGGQRAIVFAGFDGTNTQFVSVDASGRPNVNVNGSVAVTGTVTANIGTAGGLALNATLTGGTQRTQLTDGTNNVGVANTTPGAGAFGLVVRNIPSGTQTVSVSNFPATQPVSGTVAVSNFPATQPVSGTVTANQGTGAAATSAWAARLSDGTNFYVGPSSGQFPTSLVSGRLDVNVGAVAFMAPTGGTPPTSAALIGGISGVSFLPLMVDTLGRAIVSQGLPASAAGPWTVRLSDGAAYYNAPSSAQLPAALVGGRLDANVGSWLGATTPTVGQKAMGASLPVVLASDQTTVPTTNPSVATNNAAIPGSSTVVGGSDGTNLRPLRTRSNGVLLGRAEELQTFVLHQPAIVIGNNKSMLSLFNAGLSDVVVRIESISIVNDQSTAVTGVIGVFELRRMTGHSAGVDLTTSIEEYDTANVLSANITARTGATIAGEATRLLGRTKWSTDEWAVGTFDTEAQEHALQTLIPLFQRRSPTDQPIVLRAGEGITVKFATNSTAGSFSVQIVFSQESAA